MFKDQEKAEMFFLSILLILALFGLAAIIFLSTYTRLFTDDYCVASIAKSMSFSEYFKHEYFGWTGRYSYIIFSGLSALLGVKFTAFQPTLIILIWLFSLVWMVFPIAKLLNPPATLLTAFTYSALYLFFLIKTLPKIFESVFWNISSISYCLPLIGFTIIIGLFIRIWLDNIQGWRRVIPIILLSFINGGFSEIFSAMQITIYILAIFFISVTKNLASRKNILILLIAGLFTAILALIIVWIAPGNDVRQAASSQGQPIDLILLPKVIIRSTLIIFYSFLISSRWWILPICFVPFLVSLIEIQNKRITDIQPNSMKELWNEKWFKGVLLISLLVFILAITAAAPSSYIQGEPPPSRSMILIFFFVIIGILMVMSLLGKAIRNSSSVNMLLEENPKIIFLVRLLVIVIITVGVSTVIIQTVIFLPNHVRYAYSWDERDQSLTTLAENGVQEIYTNSIVNGFGYSDLTEDPKHWVNRCMAEYYGVKTITIQ
jgi:hypothetical protein